MSSYISPFPPGDNMPDTGTFDLHLGGSTWLKGFTVEAQQDMSDMLTDVGYNVFDHIGQFMSCSGDDNKIEDTTRPVVQWYIREHDADVPEMHEALDDLWSKINKHPDYRGGVIWSVEDVKAVADEHGIDADELDEIVDMEGWEDVSMSEGFDYTLNPLARSLGGVMSEEDED